MYRNVGGWGYGETRLSFSPPHLGDEVQHTILVFLHRHGHTDSIEGTESETLTLHLKDFTNLENPEEWYCGTQNTPLLQG